MVLKLEMGKILKIVVNVRASLICIVIMLWRYTKPRGTRAIMFFYSVKKNKVTARIHSSSIWLFHSPICLKSGDEFFGHAVVKKSEAYKSKEKGVERPVIAN